MQYTLIVDKEKPHSKAGDDKYGFKNFDNKQDLVTYVSNLSRGDDKVHKIVSLDYTGATKEMTIGFKDGHLELIYTV